MIIAIRSFYISGSREAESNVAEYSAPSKPVNPQPRKRTPQVNVLSETTTNRFTFPGFSTDIFVTGPWKT